MNLVEWLDQGAASFVVALHRPWLNAILMALTHLGDRSVLAAVMIVAPAVLLIRRRRRTAQILVIAALAGFPLSEGVKVLVQRPRPDVPWRLIDLPTSYSFPSGHALESMAVYGSAGLTVGARLRRRLLGRTVAVLGLALPLLIGVSRVYLGVHWFTDVLGGWTIGLILALLAVWADRRWGSGRPAIPSPPAPIPPSPTA
jgi:undecaprenyl-diphosphatase